MEMKNKKRIVEFRTDNKVYYKIQVKSILLFWADYMYRDGETGSGDVWESYDECKKFLDSLTPTKNVLYVTK